MYNLPYVDPSNPLTNDYHPGFPYAGGVMPPWITAPKGYQDPRLADPRLQKLPGFGAPGGMFAPNPSSIGGVPPPGSFPGTFDH